MNRRRLTGGAGSVAGPRAAAVLLTVVVSSLTLAALGAEEEEGMWAVAACAVALFVGGRRWGNGGEVAKARGGSRARLREAVPVAVEVGRRARGRDAGDGCWSICFI